nr:DUF1496 domain-containing protein [Methylocaldum sp. RMAD-M]
MRTSPILEEFDDDYLVLKQQVPGEPVCHFNDKRYAHGTYVCSGDTLLRCDYGVWIRTGSCDPDNP